jgi:hypothetical protein
MVQYVLACLSFPVYGNRKTSPDSDRTLKKCPSVNQDLFSGLSAGQLTRSFLGEIPTSMSMTWGTPQSPAKRYWPVTTACGALAS